MSSIVQHPAPRRRSLVDRVPKWSLLALYWIVQAAVLYALQAWLYASQGSVNAEEGNYFGVWPSFEDWLEILGFSDYNLNIAIGLVALTVTQAMLLWPLRQPRLVGPKGHGVRTSLVAAGLVIAGLVLAAAFATVEIVHQYKLFPEIDPDLPGGYWTFGALIILPAWAVATPLLIAFAERGPRETVVARVAQRLFVGTIIEIALLIPLDVMVRRKTSCYCWAGTYWALTFCGFIGVLAAGPAIFIPLLAKRRKPWYSTHCGACGYDMAASLTAPRCPECGVAWAAPTPAKPAVTPQPRSPAPPPAPTA